MFLPLHQLPHAQANVRKEADDRWHSAEGREVFERVMKLIRAGAGEDFLQAEFERGDLPILHDMWDLRGISIAGEQIKFPHEDNFEAIDFSYAHFTNCTFVGATFSCNFSFVRLYNCKFEGCVFAHNGFYGAFLENCTFSGCDFWDGNSITNTDCRGVRFVRCLIPENIFFDCRFDEETSVEDIQETPLVMTGSSVTLKKRNLAAIYRGIKEAYAASTSIQKAQEYYYKQMQSTTRYNAGGRARMLPGLLLELLTGYGVKPIRVLIAMFTVFVLSVAWFSPRVGFPDALMLVSGALFTFGAYSELLKSLGLLSRLVYIFTAFSGVCGVALFVTVWAVKWLRQ